VDFSGRAALFQTLFDDPAEDLDLAGEALNLLFELKDFGALFPKGLSVRVA
jgi:hypothetical protein